MQLRISVARSTGIETLTNHLSSTTVAYWYSRITVSRRPSAFFRSIFPLLYSPSRKTFMWISEYRESYGASVLVAQIFLLWPLSSSSPSSFSPSPSSFFHTSFLTRNTSEKGNIYSNYWGHQKCIKSDRVRHLMRKEECRKRKYRWASIFTVMMQRIIFPQDQYPFSVSYIDLWCVHIHMQFYLLRLKVFLEDVKPIFYAMWVLKCVGFGLPWPQHRNFPPCLTWCYIPRMYFFFTFYN